MPTLEHLVKELQDLAEVGDAAVRRLRENARDLNRKDLLGLRAETRSRLVERVKALAERLGTGGEHERTG